MDRLVIAAVLCAAAVAVAVVLRRRRRDAPTQPASWVVPAQVDRADFPRSDAPWLVVVFTSATCDSCTAVLRAAEALRAPDVAVVEAEAVRDRELHRRYAIDAVPTLVVVDADGVVRASEVGPVSASDLAEAVDRLHNGGAPG